MDIKSIYMNLIQNIVFSFLCGERQNYFEDLFHELWIKWIYLSHYKYDKTWSLIS